MQPKFLRISDFCDRYAISRATFYRLVKRGHLRIVKIGNASRIRIEDAEAWLESLSQGPAN